MNSKSSLIFIALTALTVVLTFDALIGGSESSTANLAFAAIALASCGAAGNRHNPWFFVILGIIATSAYPLSPGYWIIAPMVLTGLAWMTAIHPVTAKDSSCPAS